MMMTIVMMMVKSSEILPLKYITIRSRINRYDRVMWGVFFLNFFFFWHFFSYNFKQTSSITTTVYFYYYLIISLFTTNNTHTHTFKIKQTNKNYDTTAKKYFIKKFFYLIFFTPLIFF